MNNTDFSKLSRAEVSYYLLLSKLHYFREELTKVTLSRVPTARYLQSTVCAYLVDNNHLPHTEVFRLQDDDYIAFLSAVSSDFPYADFVDLTDSSYKLTDFKYRGDTNG